MKNYLWTLPVIAGIALAASSLNSLAEADSVRHSRNVFAIQKSAYGKLLARLSESTIDRVWHLGVEQVLPHDVADCPDCEHGDHGHSHHGHDHSDHGHDHSDHGHDHSDHGHDHSDHGHEKVAHAQSSHEHSANCKHEHCDHQHSEECKHEDCEHEHEHDEAVHVCGEHCDHDHDHDHLAESSASSEKPLLERAKGWFNDMKVSKYHRTNPKAISGRHLAAVKKDVEEKLLDSYKMDPTHYGAYNSYHLFLTTHSFGGTDASREHAKVIAEHTIANVAQENEDPEPWLTAASAAMNLYLMETDDYRIKDEPIPLTLLRHYESRIGYCLQKFDELQTRSVDNGVWDNLSQERQREIAEKARFASKTFEQFDVMIARQEERSQSSPEGEIADANKSEQEEE